MHMHPLPQASDLSAAGGSGDSSFTALLGLPPSQAMELFLPLPLPLPPAHASSPTFPSDAGLVDRASRLSAFAAAAAAAGSGSGVCSPSTIPASPSQPEPPPPAKRKEVDRPPKGKGKKAKTGAADGGVGDDGERPGYVHVRARRGQATDSHSLAERARREKINARMELLKELVPGCSKVSGTALVLDEIINHVQSLQRQVEYLSMRLAAVNPRIDFAGLDGFLASELQCGRTAGLADKNSTEVEQWQELGAHEARQLYQLQQQFWQGELMHLHQLPSVWERPCEASPQMFVNPGVSLFGYDIANSAATTPPVSRLKMEL